MKVTLIKYVQSLNPAKRIRCCHSVFKGLLHATMKQKLAAIWSRKDIWIALWQTRPNSNISNSEN